MVETFIQDLKEAIWEAKGTSDGKGTMVSLYGKCESAVIAPWTESDL
jgi:hypothetical protein